MIREASPNNQQKPSAIDSSSPLARVFDQILESCQIIDFDYRYAYLNDAAVRSSKTSRDVLMGNKVVDCFPSIEKTPLWDAITFTMEQRTPHHIETDFTYPDGSIGYFDMSIQPVPEGVLIFTLDITRRKKAEIDLRDREEHLRLAVESASIGTYETNILTQRTFISSQLAKLFGFGDQPVEIPYYQAFNYLHPDDRDMVRTQYCPMGNPNPPEFNQIEARVIRPDGKIRWFSWRSRTQFIVGDNGRQPWKTIGAAIDITERREAQHQIQQQAKLLQAVTDGATDAIYIRDLMGRYSFINRAACDQNNLDPDSIRGKDDSELYAPGSVKFIRELDKKIIDTGETAEVTEEIVAKNGQKRIYHSIKSPFRDSAGKIIGVIGFSRDITERQQQQKEILAAELRYRASIDQATDGIMIFDSLINGHVIDCNLRACELLGYSTEELIGMTPDDFDFDITENNKHRIVDELQTNQQYVFRTRHKRKNQSVYWVEVRLRPFQLDQQYYVVAIVRDLTEELKSQEIATKYEERMRAAQRVAKLGVWEWDLKEQVWWSDEVHAIFGRDPQTYKPTLEGFRSHMTPSTQQMVRQHFEQTISTGEPYRFTFSITDAHGHEKWLYNEGTLERDASGTPIRLWGVCQDITERRKMEDEATLARSEVAHLSRVASIGEMASSLAHELNQPLTVIKSYAGISLDMAKKNLGDAESDRQAELMTEINFQANRAAEIIRSLRAFLRKQSVQKSNVDINLIVSQAFDLVRHELETASVVHMIDLQPNLPVIQADPIQLQQVMVNLIQNAIDAMESNLTLSEKLLTISTTRTEQGIRVEVCDNGKGIAAGEEKKIFQSFYTTKTNGLGLGLPICHSIIESHGGSLRAERLVTSGMKFVFVVPAIQHSE